MTSSWHPMDKQKSTFIVGVIILAVCAVLLSLLCVLCKFCVTSKRARKWAVLAWCWRDNSNNVNGPDNSYNKNKVGTLVNAFVRSFFHSLGTELCF